MTSIFTKKDLLLLLFIISISTALTRLPISCLHVLFKINISVKYWMQFFFMSSLFNSQFHSCSGIWTIIINMFQIEYNLDIQGSGLLPKNIKLLSCSSRRKDRSNYSMSFYIQKNWLLWDSATWTVKGQHRKKTGEKTTQNSSQDTEKHFVEN